MWTKRKLSLLRKLQAARWSNESMAYFFDMPVQQIDLMLWQIIGRTDDEVLELQNEPRSSGPA
jgi:hypothetical protein